MNDADFSGLTATAPPAAANGTHRNTKKNKAGRKEAGESGAVDTQSAAQPMTAGFVINEVEPIDAPMWLLHAALWLQSEQAPSIPAWTGLAIERHHRIPAPDFLHSDGASPNRDGVLDTSCEPLRPAGHGEFPQSGLEPLGWDPRAISRRQGDQ